MDLQDVFAFMLIGFAIAGAVCIGAWASSWWAGGAAFCVLMIGARGAR